MMHTQEHLHIGATQDDRMRTAVDLLLMQIYGPQAAFMQQVKAAVSLTHAQVETILTMRTEEFTTLLKEVGYYSERMAEDQFTRFVAEEAERTRSLLTDTVHELE